MHVFQLTSKRMETEDHVKYTGYGIYFQNQDTGRECLIADISLQKKEVEALLALCREGGVTEETLLDVVEDFLAKGSSFPPLVESQ